MNKKVVVAVVVSLLAFSVGTFTLAATAKKAVKTVTKTKVVTKTKKVKNSAPTKTTKPAPVTRSVNIQNFSFDQTPLTIKQGDTVVWTNKDSAPHTVTGDNGGPSSGTLNQNQTYSFTFINNGSFAYHCNFHPSMKGTVTVTQ